MTGSSVEVCPEAVQELAVAIDNFSAKVTYLMETTDAEINGELNMMDGICEQIRQKWETAKQLLEEAKNRLYEAERELQSCEASQTKDEDGNWHPSCAAESAAVDDARAEVQAKEDEEYNRAIDKSLRNVGFMLAMDSYRKPGATCFRVDATEHLRKILTRQKFIEGQENWLRFRQVVDPGKGELEWSFDYLELCPKSVYASPDGEDRH